MAERWRKKPKQDRSKATVDALLEAAAQLLVEEGGARVTTNRIAERAGVSVGSLYQYFPNKDALLKALGQQFLDDQLESLRTRLEATLAEEGSLSEQVRAIVSALLETRRLNPDLSRALIQQAPAYAQEPLRQLHEQATSFVELALTVRSADVRPERAAIAAHIIVHAMHGVIMATVLDHQSLLDDEEFVDECVELVLRYLDKPAP